jgi:hypothetical protein
LAYPEALFPQAEELGYPEEVRRLMERTVFQKERRSGVTTTGGAGGKLFSWGPVFSSVAFGFCVGGTASAWVTGDGGGGTGTGGSAGGDGSGGLAGALLNGLLGGSVEGGVLICGEPESLGFAGSVALAEVFSISARETGGFSAIKTGGAGGKLSGGVGGFASPAA